MKVYRIKPIFSKIGILPLCFICFTVFFQNCGKGFEASESGFVTNSSSDETNPDEPPALDCELGYHREDGACVTNKKSCPIVNGTGEQLWSGSAYGTCTVVSCNLNYRNQSNACVFSASSCPIVNGNGETQQDGTCRLVSCNQNYHITSGRCDPDRRDCSAANGLGQEVWNGASYGPCTATARPVFMAMGHVRSTMYSCDGETWRGYRTANTNTRCWDGSSPNNLECDHQSTSGTGLTYGPNGFMASYGWGSPGQVEISSDGINWRTVYSGRTWAGVAYGNGNYILNERQPLVSANNGQTWTSGGDINFIPWNARSISFINLDGGLFISTADSGGTMDMMISRNNGASFMRPSMLPANCGNGQIAYNNSAILIYSQSLCRSMDLGQTWQELPIRPGDGNLISVGTQFKAFDRGHVYTSTNNGSSWTSQPLQINGVENSISANLTFEHVSYSSALQKYVGIVQGWGGYYERTEYYHSTNGINWFQVNKAAGHAPRSPHPIRKVVTGYLPQASCN